MKKLALVALLCVVGISLWGVQSRNVIGGDDPQRAEKRDTKSPRDLPLIEALTAQSELNWYLRLYRAHASSLSPAEVTRTLTDLRETMAKQPLEHRLEIVERLLSSQEQEDRAAGLAALHEINQSNSRRDARGDSK